MRKWMKLTAWILVLVLTLQTAPAPAAAAVREPSRTAAAEPAPAEPTSTESAPDPEPLLEPQAMQPPVQPADVAEDFAWTLEDGVLTITGNGAMPNWVYGGAPWYSRRSEITSVIVEHGITAVGAYAFSNCTSLVSAELTDSLTIVGQYAFYICASLTGIELPDSVTAIGDNSFEDCTSLTEVRMPGSLSTIGSGAFRGCTSLARIELPDSLITIGKYAFSGCTALTGIALPDSITAIGGGSFEGCTSLAGIKLPDSLVTISGSAFEGCTSLAEVRMPDSLTTIGNYAFYDCTALNVIALPDSLTSIGYQAFRGCTSLESVKLPAELTSMSNGMFLNCTALTGIQLPEGLISIDYSAFRGCASLTGITIPDTVTTIGSDVFNGCTALTRIELPDGLTRISDGLFSGCTALAAIKLPSDLTNIGEDAFGNCTALAEIEIPDSVTTTGSGVFNGCTALTRIELPDGLTRISDALFAGCTALTTIKLPSDLTNIGSWTFGYCTALAEIEIPEGVTYIGDSAFQSCTALTAITLPEGLTEIDESAFENCAGLVLTELPDSVTTIGWKAFKDCSALALKKLPDSLTELSSEAFYNCDALTIKEIPAGVARIGSEAFYSCNSLTEITIQEGVTDIELRAFYGCGSLEKVVLPMSAAYIHDWAFWGSPVTIYGYAGSYAEQFAGDNEYPFVSLGRFGAPVIRLRLLDAAGNVLEEGYRLEWYQNGELIGSGDVLRAQESGCTYTCRVILEDTLLAVYAPPEEITFEVGEEDMTLECVLRSIPRLTLSGKLLGDDDAGLAGTVRITQTFHGTLTRELAFTSAEDGSFSAEVAAVPTTLLFQAEGFRNQTLPLTLTGLTQDYPLGEVQLVRLPEAKVVLELHRRDAVRPGDTAAQTKLNDFEGWSFTVKNMTRNTDVADFTIQYPYLIPAEGLAAAGDTLRICAENADAGIVCEPVEVQLNELAAGRCVLTFGQQGSFVLDEILGRPQSRVLIFGIDGTLVGEDLTYQGWRSMDLSAGSYQVVLMEPTELLGTVRSLAVLDEYGLTSGQDYTMLDVTIENGIITVIEQIQVPELDESRLFYTDSGKTNVSLNTTSTFVGKYVLLRVEYAMREEYDTESETVYIQIPDGLQPADSSLTVDNQKVPFTVEDGVISVRVDQPQAVIRLYLLGRDIGRYLVDARLSFALDGIPVAQPLGTVALDLSVASFQLPERTSFHELIISGTAVPNSTITIYDGETALKKVDSNSAGSWQAEVVLDNPYSYVYHAVSVGVTHENLEQEIRSEPELVIYDAAHVEPVKVTMYNGGGKTVFDFRNPGMDPFYIQDGSDFTFVVELNRNEDPLIDQVYVVTADSNSQTTYIECVYDRTKNVWVGAHQYSRSADAPTGLDVRISMKDSDSPVLEDEFVEELENKYQEILDAFDKEMEQTRAELEKEVILPDLKGMTIDEVVSYTKEVQSDTQTLQKETEDTLRNNLQAQGIIMEKTESGTRVSNGTKGIVYREQVLEQVDQGDLKQKGYTSMPIPGKEPVYIQMNGRTIDMVDPNTKSRIICELEDYMGAEVDITDPSSLLAYKGMAENFRDFYFGEVTKPDNYYQKQWKKLTKNNIRTQISMQDLDEKIFDLKQLNADPDLISKYQKQYDDLRSLEALQSDELGDLTKQLRNVELLESLDLFDFVSLAMSAQSLGESIDKGATLRLVHSSLAGTCANNEEYQRLSREISVVSTSMNIAAGGGVVIDSVSIFATAINPLAGLCLGLCSFGAQKIADDTLNREYNRIGNKLKTLDCDGDGIPDYLEEMSMKVQKRVIIDPSGYVYEAVPSNRLEGVKAEIYYQGYPLDEYGVPSEEPVDILWDAENYDQVNPQYTDTEGRYHWDVPFGLWLVKYSKEGYLDTDSKDDPAANEDGYLPVPPPQLEVNVGMVSTAAPEVESLNVYQDQIQIIFSQYMKPDGINLSVVSGGKVISGKLEPANAEYNEEQTEQFATIFNFIPVTELSGTATVTISRAVNYAGTKMTAFHTQTKNVTVRPTAVSIAQEDTLLYGETLELEVRILPAAAGANKTLTITTSAPGLVDVAEQTVTTDEKGVATITVIGSLPTSADVTVQLDGTDLESTALIHVELPRSGACEKVTASIPSGSTVDAGTELELFTATEGAQIYYTLDGTCPCVVDSPSRILYTGPIVLTEDAFIIAYAVKEGFKDSATAGFMYTVVEKPANPFTDVPEGSFYYEPVLWAVEKGITNGTSATTFSPDDKCMRAHVVTFLWRAAGSPEPTKTDNPFVDVKESDFYYKAVLWAVEKGVTNGVDATHFGPFANCNRAQVVTFLYRSLGSPAVESQNNPFTDVPAGQWFTAPVLWAVENGVTNGLSATAFGPNAICNRAQIVTFLYRAFVD